jgi:hypothetical protein
MKRITTLRFWTAPAIVVALAAVAFGQSDGSITGNYTGLAVTNNTRPSGNTSVLGAFFGEYNGARDPRIIQVAVKDPTPTRTI